MAELQGANIHIIGVLEKDERTKAIFEEIMAEKFPNLVKTMNSQIQEPSKSHAPEIWGETTYTKAQHNQIVQDQ